MRLGFGALVGLTSCQLVSGLADIEVGDGVSSTAGGAGAVGGTGAIGGVGAAASGGGGAGGDPPAGGGGSGGDGGGPPVESIIADGLDLPIDVAVDDDAVYFAERASTAGLGAIWRWSKTAGVDAVEIATDETFPHALALSGDALFFAAGPNGAQDVVRIDLTTLDRDVIATPGGNVTDLDTDDVHVYFAAATVSRVPIGGGTPEPFATAAGGIRDLEARDATHVYYATTTNAGRKAKVAGVEEPLYGGDAVGVVVTDSVRAYVAETFAIGGVVAFPKAGGTSFTVASLFFYPRDLASDRGTGEIFWTNCATPRGVYVAAGDGSDRPLELHPATGCPTGIALDATFVYWTDEETGEVWRTPRP